jgi:hypothetical protein
LLIAADVNRSGSITTSDLIELRKLILGVISVYSNAKSWMFVPKSFQFPDPANPWTFPETLEYNPLNTTVTDADFVGIKMGDVNNSAVLGVPQHKTMCFILSPLWKANQFFTSCLLKENWKSLAFKWS